MRKSLIIPLLFTTMLTVSTDKVSARVVCWGGDSQSVSCPAINGCAAEKTRKCIESPKGDQYNVWGSYGSCQKVNRRCVEKVTPTCTAPLSLCGTTCVNKLTSSSNCGACGKVCTKTAAGVSTVCFNGDCIPNESNDTSDPGAPVGCPGKISYDAKAGTCSYVYNGKTVSGTYVQENSSKAGECKNNERCTYYRRECQVGKQWCLIDTGSVCKPEVCSPGNAPSPVPSPSPKPSPVAACNSLLVYTKSWALLNAASMVDYKAGDQFYMCALGLGNTGTFTKAQFTVNGTARAEVTFKKPGTEYFCDLYTIPENTYDFKTSALVYNSVLGWK